MDPFRPESSTWQGQKVLITGGAGFIGSTLAIRAAELGADVTVIDSLIPEYGGCLFNLDPIKDKIRINLSDIRDSFSLRPLIENVDILFNLAGQTSHMDSMKDPHTDLTINCMAQLNLLETCRQFNPNIRIIFASTRQIYGKPTYLPVDENHSINPVDINGIHKYAAELYYGLYGKIHGIHTCILRLTNTIGPRMRIKDARQTFVGIWIRQLLEGQPIEVWGGEQLRDFNDVEDVVRAMLITSQDVNCFGKIFNLGSDEKISLIKLANMMKEIHGSGEIKIMDYPPERKKIDIGDYYSSFERLKAMTGWEPAQSLEQTLQRTLGYYTDYLSAYI
jgi:nucleoside-diphosphate-sugar epimerase